MSPLGSSSRTWARGAVGYAVAKRTMDVALAILMLVALLPLLVLIAVAIKLDSSGPVLGSAVALLGPLLVLAGAAGAMLVARAAYDGAGWPVTVSLAGLVALTVVELAGHAASESGMRIARPAAWLVAVAGLIVATAGLAGVIG